MFPGFSLSLVVAISPPPPIFMVMEFGTLGMHKFAAIVFPFQSFRYHINQNREKSREQYKGFQNAQIDFSKLNKTHDSSIELV